MPMFMFLTPRYRHYSYDECRFSSRRPLALIYINGEEIAFENGRISDFQGLVTLTLTLDRVILHTFMHHSSTSTYIPNFIEVEETFLDGRTGGRTFETHCISVLGLGRLEGVDLING